MDDSNPQIKPQFKFYFHCEACGASLSNRRSTNVKNGIVESPYCSKCYSAPYDTSSTDRDYEHQVICDMIGSNNYTTIDDNFC